LCGEENFDAQNFLCIFASSTRKIIPSCSLALPLQAIYADTNHGSLIRVRPITSYLAALLARIQIAAIYPIEKKCVLDAIFSAIPAYFGIARETALAPRYWFELHLGRAAP
jgi:hypothetical protein